MQLPPVLTRALLASLFLLLLSPAAAGQASWNFVVEDEGLEDVGRVIKHKCPTANLLRFTSGEKFFRFDPGADAVLFGPQSSRWIHAAIDATGLETKTYTFPVTVECLDCNLTECHMQKATIQVSVRVVEQRPRKREEESAGEKAKATQIMGGLRGKLQSVIREFQRRANGLRPLKDAARRDGVKVEGPVFDAAAVLKIIQDTKEDILNALKAEELQPLRYYVEENFPLRLATFDAEVGRATGPQGFSTALRSSFRAARAPSATKKVATAAEVRAAFEKVGEFLAVLEGNSGEFTLKLDSEPAEANVELWRADGKLEHKTLTNVAVPGIYPGTYIIRMKKDGFRDVEQKETLGLYLTTVTCTLVTSGTPRNCQFR